jgi:FixJ family two-component response regulator
MGTDAAATVYVVDDDRGVREATRNLLESVGLRVRTFASATEFLGAARADEPGCLILDVRLTEASGLDVQRELAGTENPLPIIFVTGLADVAMTSRAMQAGAVEFLTKPWREEDLLDAIAQAIERDREQRKRRD